MLTTFELLEELSKKSKEEIEFVLSALMKIGKIDFLNVNKAYVNYLEYTKEDELNKLIEAETCVMEGFFDNLVKEKKDTPSGRSDYTHTQRCLYLLNQSQRFNMNKANEEYHYDEEVGKSMSWYEKNKNLK